MDYCIQCEHFIGGGDFNLCCTLNYHLCYENTEACASFKPCTPEVLETRKQSYNYINCYQKWFEKEGIEI